MKADKKIFEIVFVMLYCDRKVAVGKLPYCCNNSFFTISVGKNTDSIPCRSEQDRKLRLF